MFLQLGCQLQLFLRFTTFLGERSNLHLEVTSRGPQRAMKISTTVVFAFRHATDAIDAAASFVLVVVVVGG